MTTKTTPERLAIMEEQLGQNLREHGELKVALEKIDTKLDTVIDSKTDKSEFNSLKSKLWGVAVTVLASFISMIVWIIQKN